MQVTITQLGGTCQAQQCSTWNDVYQLTQVGETCVWAYTSGNFSLVVTCAFGYWWLTLGYDDHDCAVWKYPLHGAPSCPPLGDCIWIWHSGTCSEGKAVTDPCT